MRIIPAGDLAVVIPVGIVAVLGALYTLQTAYLTDTLTGLLTPCRRVIFLWDSDLTGILHRFSDCLGDRPEVIRAYLLAMLREASKVDITPPAAWLFESQLPPCRPYKEKGFGKNPKPFVISTDFYRLSVKIKLQFMRPYSSNTLSSITPRSQPHKVAYMPSIEQ